MYAGALAPEPPPLIIVPFCAIGVAGPRNPSYTARRKSEALAAWNPAVHPVEAPDGPERFGALAA